MDIVSFARYGYAGALVKVEADLRRGIPAIAIVGLPDGAVREARERMRSAIRNSGYEFPRERILINLSPAGLKKEGSSFDLAIALSVLGSAAGLTLPGVAGKVMVLGELELSGAVRPVVAVLAAVSRGLEEGIRQFIVPTGNRREASILREAEIFAVENLSDAMQTLNALAALNADSARDSGELPPAAAKRIPGRGAREGYTVRWGTADSSGGYEDVRGQERLVRALQIAAAGAHHLIVYGPPGCGKTLALRRFPALLPELDEETAIAVTRIHGIAGLPDEAGSEGLRTTPPFREPHQNTSLEGMIGGGKSCRPGEISLAHGGSLFLDEAAQFRTSVLQSLRAPLETGSVTVSRADGTETFPARFQLLAAINPCPCGNFGEERRVCTCDAQAIERYWRRLTAPLLDRIDLRVAVSVPDPESLSAGSAGSAGAAGLETRGFSTGELRQGIARARLAQRKRNGGNDWLNAHLGASDVNRVCALKPRLASLFARGMEKARLSGRGAHGTLKVARTIADMEGAEEIAEEHLLEAIQFRRWSALVPDFLQDY